MRKDLGVESGIIASIALVRETVRHSLGISHKLLLLLLPLIKYTHYQSCIFMPMLETMPDDYTKTSRPRSKRP